MFLIEQKTTRVFFNKGLRLCFLGLKFIAGAFSGVKFLLSYCNQLWVDSIEAGHLQRL